MVLRELKDAITSEEIDKEVFESLDLILRLRKSWSSLVGERLAEHAKPYRVFKGKLYIAVDSSVWHQEIVYKKEDLRKRVQEITGQEIEDIRIKTKHKL